MKIALLGASGSGKTVYFTGLAYKFRNAIAFRPLDRVDRARYRKMKVDRRVALKIGVSNAALEKNLSDNIALLACDPIDDWPDPTENLDRSRVKCHFSFKNVSDEGGEGKEAFARSVELYDPGGEVFSGRHENSEEILESLATCDVCIVFLPADLILEGLERGDTDLLQNKLVLGRITELILDTYEEMDEDDILPVCFVISKADLLTEEVVEQVNDVIYDQILMPFSEEYGRIMMCTCPISILDPESGRFRANNLEWPFLFAAGGTIFRNSVVLREEAEDAQEAARRADREADALASEGWWSRFKSFIKGDGVGMRRRRAQSFRNEFGRLINEAEDDYDLARNVWSSLAVEARSRHVRIFMDGGEIDPRLVMG